VHEFQEKGSAPSHAADLAETFFVGGHRLAQCAEFIKKTVGYIVSIYYWTGIKKKELQKLVLVESLMS